MVRTHQPGEAVFRSILPEDIDWKPFAAFPPSVPIGRARRSTVGAGPLCDPGQGARRREADAP
jgi:hypothetical protein